MRNDEATADLGVQINRFVDDWVDLEIIVPDHETWVKIFCPGNHRFSGQHVAFWRELNGRRMWNINGDEYVRALPVTHWKNIGPDPQ